jgi:hypothetical protein
MAQAATDRAQSAAITATQKSSSGGGGFLGNILSGNIGGAVASLDPTQGDVKRAVEDVSKALSTDDAKKVMAVGAAFFVPSVGAEIGKTLIAQNVITGAAIPYATAIGTAIASTASQTAQGVPFDQALSNATTSAVVSTGAPGIAKAITPLVTYPQVADAITSAGASAFKTAIAGGSAADIEKNMTAALAGSAAASLYSDVESAESVKTGRAIGSAIGGSITGGTMGAALGAAGELGRPDTTPARPQLLAAGPSDTVSDVPSLTETLVTARREAPDIGDTSIISPDVTKGGKVPSLKTVTVTGKRETTPIEETSIIEPVSITDKPPEKDVSAEEEEPTPQKKSKTDPNLFIFGGKTPKSSGRQSADLGTTLQAPFYPSTTLGQALTGYRGAGEIEGKKSGKPRQDVWNEESLRLKDALGL